MKYEQVQIFSDFDGTVTKGDTVDLLLEMLADKQWKLIEERWVRGEIGSRECMAAQVPLIRGGWSAMLDVLETVEVDSTFVTFVNWCKLRKMPISIVSDGIDRVITHLLKREKIKVQNVWANHLLEGDDGSLSLAFPKPHRVVCQSGLCKCQVLDQAPTGTLKVVIGDGRSDFCWAGNADILFAKDKLLTYCLSNNIKHYRYENFLQVRAILDELLSGTFTETPLLAQS